jgi:hypothetical protein
MVYSGLWMDVVNVDICVRRTAGCPFYKLSKNGRNIDR